MKLGYFLSCEEFDPREIVRQAVLAKEAGFDRLWISDHFHPWNDEQGHSGFVWGLIGAIAQAAPGIHVTTAVTCPTVRTHPAIIAHAAATSAVLLDGRFSLGVGSGEALNEHIFGNPWPRAEIRQEMLEEAIEVIRLLWQGGVINHRGRHYTVEHARIYDPPPETPKIIVSGFGPKAVRLAGRIGDGYCTVGPDADSVKLFRESGGDGKLVQGGMKVCYDEDEERAIDTVHRLWPNEALPGELAQVLPTPEHFQQACELVTREMVAESVPCGPDVEKQVEKIRAYEEAGFDELYVNQIGPRQEDFFQAWQGQIRPALN